MLDKIKGFRLDGYSLALLATVLFAIVLPATGRAADALSILTAGAVTLLFFLHGAKLATKTVMAGALHWRLHLLVLAATFVLFPLLGTAIGKTAAGLLPAPLLGGVLFLTLLPSTVQSSVAFTAMAGGNVTAAICAAALSNILGTIFTPLLVALLMGIQGHDGNDFAIVRPILLQMILPFFVGQLLQSRLSPWLTSRKAQVTLVDRGSILLIVYGAFSAAVVEGLFRRVTPLQLMALVGISIVLLLVVMVVLVFTARKLGFARDDEIPILFCGSKKSLASGVPLAGVLFPAAMVGTVILPLMIFHQIQLLVCSYLAGRYARYGIAKDLSGRIDSAE